MYEQNDVPVFRRVILIGLWLLAVVAAVFVLIWFVFIRNDTTSTVAKPAKTNRSSATSKNQSGGTVDTNDNANSSTNTSSNPSPSTSTSSTSTTQNTTTNTATPSQLVDTGAGNVVAPVAIAAVSGAVLYNIRLRRKLLH